MNSQDIQMKIYSRIQRGVCRGDGEEHLYFWRSLRDAWQRSPLICQTEAQTWIDVSVSSLQVVDEVLPHIQVIRFASEIYTLIELLLEMEQKEERT